MHPCSARAPFHSSSKEREDAHHLTAAADDSTDDMAAWVLPACVAQATCLSDRPSLTSTASRRSVSRRRVGTLGGVYARPARGLRVGRARADTSEGGERHISPPPDPEPPSPPAEPADANNGKTIAGAGFALGVGLFALTSLGGAPTLASLEKDAVPLDVALGNGRPTVIEFYADW